MNDLVLHLLQQNIIVTYDDLYWCPKRTGLNILGMLVDAVCSQKAIVKNEWLQNLLYDNYNLCKKDKYLLIEYIQRLLPVYKRINLNDECAVLQFASCAELQCKLFKACLANDAILQFAQTVQFNAGLQARGKKYSNECILMLLLLRVSVFGVNKNLLKIFKILANNFY